MNVHGFESYLIFAAIFGYFYWRHLRFKKVRALLPKLIAEGAIVLDVRSSAEFQQGARPGSLNIPLAEVVTRSKELDKSKTIIICCASGSRSGIAAGLLRGQGFTTVLNAGSWTNTLA